MLGVPFSTSNKEPILRKFISGLSNSFKLFHTMSSCQKNIGIYQRSSTLKLFLVRFTTKHSAHGRPLSKLRLTLGESLNSSSKSIVIPFSTLAHIFWMRRGWNIIRILAANIQESRTFALLWIECSKSISDVNYSCSVCDDGSICTLIVWYTLIPSIIRTIFKSCVFLHKSMRNRVEVIIRWCRGVSDG